MFRLPCVKSPVHLFSFFSFSYLKVDMYDDELCIHVLMTCPFFVSLVFGYILTGTMKERCKYEIVQWQLCHLARDTE
ncbi:hypothetical protein BDV36DRAFT_241038 [Aspergillus pseudocaelatus]|uniref:Uncharacterized protein n=1 Tax=Aspergillus pseudocaelatus TaxID=1825620 RepID=A0ABQ6WBL5_9EURO|nr:hypothetical protein BDV36DRAFT_241038 [Aspergillus pseudocaelatus]